MKTDPPSHPERKGITISLISTAFAFLALGICVYGLFYSSETAIRTQAIYWFCIALASAVVPYLKDIAPYVRRIKVGDVEVELNELKKEVHAVKDDVRRLDERLLATLTRVSQREASIPEPLRKVRKAVYGKFAEGLAETAPDEKLREQERYTRMHLADAPMDILQLKEALSQLGYYHDSIDEEFSPELAKSIERFQSENVEGKPDGIAGSMTLAAIGRLWSQKKEP